MTDLTKPSQKPAEEKVTSPAAEAEKPVSPEVKAIIDESQKKRLDLAKQLGLESPPATKTPGPESAEQGKGTSPAKPGEPASKPPVPEQKPQPAAAADKKAKDLAEYYVKSRNEARSSSLGDLFGKLISAVKKMGGVLNGFMDKLTGAAQKKPVEDPKAPKYSKEELDKIALDLKKEKDKKYPAQDKAAEYVTGVLGLPARETPQKLLDTLKNSGMVLENDPGKMKNLVPGDVLFFQKKNEKGEPYAYMTAVVSNADPLKMKLVPKGGGTPQEMTVKDSDYFKNEWYGFVKLPKPSTPS
jgi:hypothetical protein